MAWVKNAPDSQSTHGDVDVEKGLAGKAVRMSDESGRGSADAGSARQAPPSEGDKAAAARAKRDRYKSMTTTALETARQQAQAERDAAAQGYDAAERAEREYLARKRAKAAHRDWAETQAQWREGTALLRAAFAGFWRAVANVRHLLAWRAQERRQSAQIVDAQRADVEKRKIEEKLRRELAADDDDDEPAPADADAPAVPAVPAVHQGHRGPNNNRSLTQVPSSHSLVKAPSSHSLASAAKDHQGRPSNAESGVLPVENKQ